MNKDEYTRIEDYLLGKLSEADARMVERRAETDREFARELQLQKDILEGIELAGDEHMRAKIAGIDRALAQKGFFGPDGQISTPDRSGFGAYLYRFRWAAAATVLLLLTAGLWWLFAPETPPQQASQQTHPATPPALPKADAPPETTPTVPIAETAPATPRRQPKAASPYLALARSEWSTPDFSNLRAIARTTSDTLSQAVAAFQKKEYGKAIELLAPFTPDYPNYWPASEVYAHACFLSGKTEAATWRFRQIADSGELPFSERADWYLLLCELTRFPEGKAAFEEQLNKILADPGHPYFEAAQGLAERMEK